MGLKINLLGGIKILHQEKQIKTNLSVKSIAILTMLVTAYPNKLPRTKLSETLWPENYENANYNLRYNLWNIKKSLPQDKDQKFIIADKEYCYINPEYEFSSDIDIYRNLEKQTLSEKLTEELENIRKSFKGEFLEDFFIKDAQEYYEWVLINRLHYQKLYLECLKQLSKRYNQRRHYQELIEVSEDILKINPYDEESHYQIIKSYDKLGESYKAIAQYKKCDAVLRSELNIGPEQKLKDLYLNLISQRENIKESGDPKTSTIININHSPNKTIEYYAISQLINQLKPHIKTIQLDELSSYKETLGYIDPYFGRPKTPLLDISLLISLSEIIKKIWEQKTLIIKIHNKDKLDQKSKIAFDYLENNIKSATINLSYEK